MTRSKGVGELVGVPGERDGEVGPGTGGFRDVGCRRGNSEEEGFGLGGQVSKAGQAGW